MNNTLKSTSLLLVFILLFLLWSYENESDIIDSMNYELMINPASAGKPVFDLLDATQFTDPMYPWLGLPVVVLSEQQLLGSRDNVNLPPNEEKVKAALLNYKDRNRIILNIESWKIDLNEVVLTQLHIEWSLLVIKWAKEVLPRTDVGLFGVPYLPWSPQKSTNKNILDSQLAYSLVAPIIDVSDTLYPLLQVFSEEESDLYFLMGAQLYIANSTEKPVYPIVSHKNVTKGKHFDEIMAVEFIQKQCEFVRTNADGMVWWSPEHEDWDSRWYEDVAKQCFL